MVQAKPDFGELPILLYDEKHTAHRVRLGDKAAFKIIGEGGIWQSIIVQVDETEITIESDHCVASGAQVILSPPDYWQQGRVNHALAQCVCAVQNGRDVAYSIELKILYFMN